MSTKHNSYRIPYQHLAVLGMSKLKKYVPPSVDKPRTQPKDEIVASRRLPER